jgi:predicted dinucleotide-utilizing enzyme
MFTIDDVIATLNDIEVKGKKNLDKLLGAIMALEFMKKADEEKIKDVVTETHEPEKDGGVTDG